MKVYYNLEGKPPDEANKIEFDVDGFMKIHMTHGQRVLHSRHLLRIED